MRPSEIKTVEGALQFLGVTEQQVREYFQQVEEVMHHLIISTGIDLESAEGYWCSGINPYYNQLTPKNGEGLGLALVEYYGGPSSLSTPFGHIAIGGIGAKDPEWFYEVREDFGLKPLWGDFVKSEPQDNGLFDREDATYVFENDVGCFGPVWQISKFLDRFSFPIRISCPVTSAFRP